MGPHIVPLVRYGPTSGSHVPGRLAPRYVRLPLARGPLSVFSEVRLSVLAFRGRSKHDTWSQQVGFRVSRRARLKEETRTFAMDGSVEDQQ